MSKVQQITVDEDGNLSGVVFNGKEGYIDLTNIRCNRREEGRASHVLFDAEKQAYYVVPCVGPNAAYKLIVNGEVGYFKKRNDAITAEIDYLNDLGLQSHKELTNYKPTGVYK